MVVIAMARIVPIIGSRNGRRLVNFASVTLKLNTETWNWKFGRVELGLNRRFLVNEKPEGAVDGNVNEDPDAQPNNIREHEL